MARGMIRKRGQIWYIIYPFNGKKKWEKVGPKKRQAEKLLAARLESVRQGTFRELKKVTFDEFSEKWLEWRDAEIRSSTKDAYRSIIKTHLKPRFRGWELNMIATDDVQDFISGLNRRVSSKTIVNILVVLKKMLADAVLWRHLTVNPAVHVKRPKVEHYEVRIPTRDQVKAFLEAVKSEYYVLFLTFVMSGLRIGELLALRWQDIDWENQELRVRRSIYRGSFGPPKTRRSQWEVAMSRTLVHELKKHRFRCPKSNLDLIFCSEDGGPLDPDNLRKRAFIPAIERAEVPRFRIHDLRHFYASVLIHQGESVRYVMDQMGHESSKTTLDRYGHLFPSDKRQAAERLDAAMSDVIGSQ